MSKIAADDPEVIETLTQLSRPLPDRYYHHIRIIQPAALEALRDIGNRKPELRKRNVPAPIEALPSTVA